MQQYERYKPSGVERLGEIPEHWSLKRVKHIHTVNPSGNSSRAGELVTFVPMEAMNSDGTFDIHRQGLRQLFGPSLTEFQVGDVLLAKITPCFENGKGALVSDLPTPKGIGSTEFHVFRPSATINPKFTYYLLHNDAFRVAAVPFMEGTAGQKRITTPFVKNLLIALPPRQEQDRIVTFLDRKATEIDAAIAKKKRLIDFFQEQKDILITQAVTRGLNPMARMRDSGVTWIGQVPAHWQQMANRTLFRERKESGHADFPILSVSLHTGVSDEEQDDTENVRAKIRIEDKTSYKRVRPGDVTYNMMRAWQGAIGVVRVDGLVSPAYVVAAPLATINGAYFEYLYRTHGFIREMDRYSKGITDFRKRLYWDEFKQLVSLLPPLDEQIQIAAYAEQIINQTSALTEKIRDQIEALNEFRASLIENLVTGKIKT
ncbi:hypothetical protein os1_02570 [Comamonadaceae bacterium OS-1]|nr:hypothetical protein os1_02570 [Comamonadaceae bacterium OS-1]